MENSRLLTDHDTSTSEVIPPVAGVILNQDQTRALEEINNFFNSDAPGGMFLLEGYAGTGKTTLICHWLQSLPYHLNVFLCAPTNKAVRVITEKVPEGTNASLEFATVHRLFGLREKINSDGFITFEQDKKAKQFNLSSTSAIVIDESSMLSDALYDMLREESKRTKIIFTGDSSQVPPVGHELARPHQPNIQKRDNIIRYALNTIVRQTEGNPLVNLSMIVRGHAFNDNRYGFTSAVQADNKHLCYYPYALPGTPSPLNERIEKVFTSAYYKSKLEAAKVVAWTNAEVHGYNIYIHELIYGRDVPTYVEGELLVFKSPLIEKNKIIFSNSDMVRVSSVETTTVRFRTKIYNCWQMRVVNVYDERAGVRMIKVIMEKDRKEYEQDLENERVMAVEARNKSKDPKTYYENPFLTFFNMRDAVAKVEHNYATTAHRSQGSTYEEVFVLWYDILKNRKVDERNSIYYTALTRPSRRANIII